MSKSKISQPFDDHQKPSHKHSKKQNNQLNSSSDSQNQGLQNQQKSKQVQPSCIQFGDSPIQMKCPFCLQNIRSQIILKPQFISILFGFSLFVIFPHIISLILTIVVLQITATRKHRCPLCERQLGSDGKFLVFFKDEVYSFAFGTNGIIISKKILTTIGIGVAIFIVLSLRINDAYADVQWTQLTWPQFERNCPFQSVSSKCQNQNQGYTVKNWRGYVMRVQDNRNSIKKHFQHAVSIFIKMNSQNSLNKNPQRPDLFLTITSYQTHVYQQSLDKLSHGDQILFNGTFKYLRNNRGIPIGRHLNLIDMNRTGHHNPNVNVYMSKDQDKWFFENLSGDKLRKQAEAGQHNLDIKSSEITQKQVQKQLNRLAQNQKAQLTNKQQQVIKDSQQDKAETPQPNT